MNSTENSVIILLFSSLCISLVLSITCPYIDKNGNIANISKDSLPANLIQIFFFGHPLTNISDDAFDKSASTLNYLQMEGAKFTKLPDALLKLNNLTTLAITFTDIKDWNIPLFHHLAPTLQNLWLFDVGDPEWPRLLSILTSLNSLSIAVSSFNSIPVDTFRNVSDTLSDVSISLCIFNDLPTALLNLRNLRKLSLSENQLKNISAFTSANLTSLTELDLSGNLLADVPPNTLPGNLTRLDINNNKITQISDTALFSCPKLQSLMLSGNPISAISGTAFENLRSLANLAMRGSNLAQIPLALLQLQSLKHVDLTSDTPILCPCPPAPEWTKWYASYNGSLQIDGSCSNGESIQAYLSGLCPQAPACTQCNVGTLVTNHWNQYIWMLFLVLAVFASL